MTRLGADGRLGSGGRTTGFDDERDVVGDGVGVGEVVGARGTVGVGVGSTVGVGGGGGVRGGSGGARRGGGGVGVGVRDGSGRARWCGIRHRPDGWATLEGGSQCSGQGRNIPCHHTMEGVHRQKCQGNGEQSGARLSRNESRPSEASSVPYASRVASPAKSCWPTRPSSTELKANFSIRIAVGDLVRMVRAIPIACFSSSACGATRLTAPISYARCAEYSSARKKTSRANFCPIWRAK